MYSYHFRWGDGRMLYCQKRTFSASPCFEFEYELVFFPEVRKVMSGFSGEKVGITLEQYARLTVQVRYQNFF